MKTSIRFLGTVVLTMITMFGCGGGSSEVEMNSAQKSMDEAKSYRAEELASADWKDAMQSWDEAQTAAASGDSSAKTLFLRAKSRFDKSAEIAKARQERLAQEIGDLQLSISSGLARLKSAVESGGVAARLRSDLTDACTEIEKEVADINGSVTAGDYTKARTVAQQTLEKVQKAELLLMGKSAS